MVTFYARGYRMSIKTKVFTAAFLLIFSFPAFSKNIAVLPFQNLTQDADKNWIGAGFSETLTTKLWNVKSISMVERQQ